MSRSLSSPCTKRVQSEFFSGVHNTVLVFDHGTVIGKRCVSCGAADSTYRSTSVGGAKATTKVDQ
jgi:hypothetical protein